MHKSIKPLVALVLTGIGSALVFTFKTADTPLPTTASASKTAQAPTATSRPNAATTGTTPAQATAAPSVAPTSAATAGSASTAAYADGTYNGAAVSEPWGTFEVEAIVRNGQLSDVQLVASPRDRHSSQINAVAVPLLTESAIAAQSANVDVVSGATWTSESYAESLQAALDAAAAAASTQQVTG